MLIGFKNFRGWHRIYSYLAVDGGVRAWIDEVYAPRPPRADRTHYIRTGEWAERASG